MNEPQNAILFSNVGSRVVSLSLSDLSNETATRFQDLTEPFFLGCFLHVTRVSFVSCTTDLARGELFVSI